MSITASQISILLRQKHPIEKFLVVEECKVGATWSSEYCPRLDMWVMARSWRHSRFIGYEIKVNRSDFINDLKWREYLKYCTEFYFVAPPDIMDQSELPEEAGLLVTSRNAKKLYTKKKAPMRDIEIPQSILVYILMCRAHIVGDMMRNRPRIEIYKERVNELKKNKKLGYDLSYLISKRVKYEVGELKNENKLLREENERFLELKKWLEGRDISLDDAISRYGMVKTSKLEELITGLPFHLTEFLENAEHNLSMALKAIKDGKGR